MHKKRCECHKCIDDFGLTIGAVGSLSSWLDALPLSAGQMILCPDCGNKRCPKASNHRLECTDSNEPNQEGSVY